MTENAPESPQTNPSPNLNPDLQTREDVTARLLALSKTRITELRAEAINAARSLAPTPENPANKPMTWAEIAKALDMTPQGISRMKGVHS